MSSTTVHNRTNDVLDVCTGYCTGYYDFPEGRQAIIPPGARRRLTADDTETLPEQWIVRPSGSNTIVVSSYDCERWNSIEVVSREDDPTIFVWIGVERRWESLEREAALTAWNDAFSIFGRKIEACARFSVNMEEDLKRVVTYRAQCAHLAQFCSVLGQKIKRIGTLVSVHRMWRLYDLRKLPQLANSLDILLCALLSAQKLMKGCGKKEWRRAALVLSLPSPDPQNLEKYSGSKFAHVIRELGWSSDMVQYAMSEDGTESFKWDDGRDRYVLQGNQLEIGVAFDEMELLQGDIYRETCDRQELLRDLKNGSLKENIFIPRLAGWLGYNTPHEIFAATVQNRYQNQFFDIDHLDLRKKNRISKGGDKKVHRGEWLGLEVAIATIKNTPREAVEMEAGFMVRVHHPNVVDFFGCAFKKEEGGAAQEDQEDQWTAFLVMELMEEDLGHLIARITEDPCATRQSNSGCLFSLPVTVNILIQIVEAMIHSHKHQVMHRDLKPGNCLVSRKVAPRLDIDAHYIVKLTDFGISKLWESETDIHTRRRGTVQYMAPEVWDGGEYTWSTDVYSFGMLCYEVITGSKPLASLPFSRCKSIDEKFDLLRGGERPRIPGTCPESLSILMKKCWAATPDDRPTFKAIRKDLWEFKLLIDAMPYSKGDRLWFSKAVHLCSNLLNI